MSRKPRHVLLVHPNVEIGKQLKSRLEDAARNNPRRVLVDYEMNLDDARIRLEDQVYDLVITHLYLPENSGTVPDTTQRGLELLRKVREKKKTPAILITLLPADLRLKQAISTIGYTIEIDESGDSIGKIVEAANEPLNREELLSITFVQHENNVWACEVDGKTLEGTLTLSDRDIKRLRITSSGVGRIHEFPEWRDVLGSIGEDLAAMLFNTNPNLAVGLLAAIKEVGGIENTRLCFKVFQSVYGIALEAVVEPEKSKVDVLGFKPRADEEVPFWMLRAPVYRSIGVSNVRSPLFEEDRADLNCLIIEASTSGEVPPSVLLGNDGEPLYLPDIRSVKRECRELERWLRSDPGFLGKGEVYRFSADNLPPGESFETALRNKLLNEKNEKNEKKEWHIIHYSGHSYYRRPTDSTATGGGGYIFLPGDPIRPVPVGNFALWIKDAQLVTLAGCQSSEENFVFELARTMVPAVIGFRWEIEDEIATEFVLNWFYPNLFKLRSKPKAIEKAFQQARSKAYETYPKKSIWAAAMLILGEQRVGAVA